MSPVEHLQRAKELAQSCEQMAQGAMGSTLHEVAPIVMAWSNLGLLHVQIAKVSEEWPLA